MYFYVDESGHTGKNIFDSMQPVLFYGVLSSQVNLDILALPYIKDMKKKLKINRLHAVNLTNKRLAEIAADVHKINKKLKLFFDFYRVVKADYALVSFFDQVFDQGINPAVPYNVYWTPLRYVVLLRLGELFDTDTLKKVWHARLELNDEEAERLLIEVCRIVRGRLHSLSDNRLEQIIRDALQWVQNHPKEIHYNAKTKDDILQISPNIIGFQFVMNGIAKRICKKKKKVSKIIVDRQVEFNLAQSTLQDYYLKLKSNLPDEKSQLGFGLPEMDLNGMPTIPITFASSKESAGLELVDIFLWIFKRWTEKRNLPSEVMSIIKSQMHRGYTDELSLHAISNRWENWFQGHKDELDE